MIGRTLAFGLRAYQMSKRVLNLRAPKSHRVSALGLSALCYLALAAPFAVVSAQAQGQTQVPEQAEEIAPQDEKEKEVQTLMPPVSLSMAESVSADFARRDALPETELPRRLWYDRGNRKKATNSWGPKAIVYPTVSPPAGVDGLEWRRQRIAAVAQKYIGLPYRHHHIPAWAPDEGPGLDCSNFTSWVYNYGLGRKFNSDVHKQAEGENAPGRKLADGEPLLMGDLLYILKRDRSKVSHVIIYLDAERIIDSHAGSVQVRKFKGWYKSHLSHARRVIE